MNEFTVNDDDIYLAAVEGGGTTFVVSIARVAQNDTPPPRRDGNSATNNNDDETNILYIGPTKLQLLDTATFPPRDIHTDILPTWTPQQIITAVCDYLVNCRKQYIPNGNRYSSLGIATFGPAGVDPSSVATYGTILSGTPKKAWRGIDLVSPFAAACGIPSSDVNVGSGSSSSSSRRKWVGFDTDVNAPALAEFRQRLHHQSIIKSSSTTAKEEVGSISKPLTSLSYITIGTGVGVGLIINSKPVHGLLHPEGGHIAIQPLVVDDNGTTTTDSTYSDNGYQWSDKSPYGGRGTVEGVTSSVALTERYLNMMNENGNGSIYHPSNNNSNDVNDAQCREVLSTLPDNHILWDHAANAIANLCVSILLLTSCQVIVLGGGIMKRSVLFDKIRHRTWIILNGYLDSVDELSCESKLSNIIVDSSWATIGSGLVGAYALALDAYNDGMQDIEQERQAVAENGTKNKMIVTKDDNDNRSTSEQSSFTVGVLVGIGMSFGCLLLTSLLGHGGRLSGRQKR
jgi:fructokinase